MNINIQDLVEKIKEFLSGHDLTISNILDVVEYLMKFVELSKLPGQEKKRLVCEAIDFFITIQYYDNELSTFIKKILPYTIDKFISIDKGEIKFNVKKICFCF